MDPELNAAVRALARLDSDAARARLAEAVGAPKEEVEAIMRGDAPDSGGTALPEPRNTCG